MNFLTRPAILSLLGLGVAFQSARPAAGQTLLSENFESVGSVAPGAFGPQALVAAGWTFRLQGNPPCTGPWHELVWNQGDFDPYEGLAQLGLDYASGGNDHSAAWILLPALAGAQAGTQIALQVYESAGWSDKFELRYSPSGGTNTGSTWDSTGDFTQVLATSIDMPWWQAWQLLSATLPGPGRIAIRHETIFNQSGLNTAGGIDALLISNSGAVNPPLPNAGQTLHWGPSLGLIQLAGNRTLPVGATLILDAGADVQVTPGTKFFVEGDLIAAGTSTSQVVVAGGTGSLLHLRNGGSLTLDHADLSCRIQPEHGNVFGTPASSLVARHTRFHGEGTIEHLFVQNLDGRHAVLIFEDCEFEGVQIQHTRCQIALRRTNIHNAGTWGVTLNGYAYLDRVLVDDGQVRISSPRGHQPMFLDRLAVVNHPSEAGLVLDGGRDYLIGANSVLQGVKYPVEFGDIEGAGLLPGSVLPTSGNIVNVVNATMQFANSHPMSGVIWAPLAIPYRVSYPMEFGGWTVLPGADVEFMPGAFAVGGVLCALGTPGQPIRFRPALPGQPWGGIHLWNYDGLNRLDHCELSGSTDGIVAVTAPLKLTNNDIHHNVSGVVVGEECEIWELGKNRIHHNTNGVRVVFSSDHSGPILGDGAINPNAITDNAVAVLNQDISPILPFNMRDNWWGSASGPNHPSNPGGTGNPLQAPVTFQPFRTQAPDFTNTPPTVRFTTAAGELFPNTKLHLRWTATDDDSIVEQRLIFGPSINDPRQFQTIATLAPGVREYEWTVPDLGYQVTNVGRALRIEATDTHGQVGWHETRAWIWTNDYTQGLTLTTNLAGPFVAGTPIQVAWTSVIPDPTLYTGVALQFLNDGRAISLGGSTLGLGQLSGLSFLPNVSTDAARLAVVVGLAGNRGTVYYSQPFAIRYDARLGDAPPQVQLLTPAHNSTHAGGAAVLVAWSASDDEGLRSFDVLASYDGGRTYHPIAKDLPATATSHVWQVPATTGIAGVRVRVVARDLRFQDSSSESTISLVSNSTPALVQCSGEGSGGASCPCGPGAAGHGCPNANFGTGARLEAVGIASVSAATDTLALTATNVPGPGLFFQAVGLLAVPSSFGDGLLCAGQNLVRLGVAFPGAGVASFPSGVNPLPLHISGAPLTAGDLRHYQCWYRDADPSFCTSALFNLTNALTLAWGP